MICKIADFTIDFKNSSKAMEELLKDYETAEQPQFILEVSPEEIELARHITPVTASVFGGEINAFHQKLLNLIPLYDAFFLHASLIQVNDVGIAFTALSGTGKTTHTLLWKKLLGNKMQVINGDKPIIRFKDNIPYGYGTPWCGKEHMGKNSKTHIKHICFIERSKYNKCEKITSVDSLKDIFNQLFIPNEPKAAVKTLQLLDKLLKSVNIWVIKCNTDIHAAQTAYNTILKGENT